MAAKPSFVAAGGEFRTTLMPDKITLNMGAAAEFRIELENADPSSDAILPTPLAGIKNQILGKHQERWQTGIRQYGEIRYRNVWPGVDVRYYGNQRDLEYDFIVAPNASPSVIRFEYEGLAGMHIDANGDLVLNLSSTEIVQQKPHIYQIVNGRRVSISGGYLREGKNRIGFRVGAYDHTRPLVIDPVLSYSTFLGGSSKDEAFGVAVDPSGNTYVVGHTASRDLPSAGTFRSYGGGPYDVFVAKYDSAGALVYTTYLGGSGDDEGYAIAADADGNAYITGNTTSSDFPTTPGAYKTSSNGARDAFIAKLGPTGALVYSTYLGGSGAEIGWAIALDSARNVYITGGTTSSDYPVTQGAYRSPNAGGSEVFVTELNAAGTALVYSAILGGADEDVGLGIAVDASGAYVTGYTASTGFSTVAGALQPGLGGVYDAFLSKLNPTGTALIYSTFLGGSASDFGFGLAVDSSGNAHVTGYTSSTNFPTTSGAYSRTNKGGLDTFIAKINPSGTAYVYSTLIGGSKDDFGLAIALDSGGNAYVTGDTSSTDFPLLTPLQSVVGGIYGAWVAQINSSGTALGFSTYLSGASFETGYGIAVGSSGTVHVAGSTASPDYPVTSGAAQKTLAGDTDAFVTRIGVTPTVTVTTSPVGLSMVVDGNTVTSPHNFNWTPGTSHTVNVTSPQNGSGVRNTFTSWSDGGAQSHTITAPSIATTYTASFSTQYQLVTAISPAGGGTVTPNPTSADGYYNSGTSVQLTASPNSGFQFVTWTGDLSGTVNPQSVTMNALRNVTANFTNTVSGPSLKFVAVTPCRIVDTRNANGTFGGPAITGQSSRSFTIPNSACAIPVNAAAYSINVTVVPITTVGYLTAYPTGQSVPLASTLNSLDGRVKANAAIVPAGNGGAISVFVTDTTHIILDINGYFVPSSGSQNLTFFPLTPCRVADTRNANGSLGGPFISGGHSRSFPVLAGTCSVPATAQAYSLNFTAVPHGSLGYITTYPTGSVLPLVSTLNAIGGQVTANAAIVPAGTNGSVDAFAANDTDLVIDINGYFASSSGGGLSLYNVTPCRVVDTRNPSGSQPFNGTKTVNVAGSLCAVPGVAQAYVFNATVVPPGALGYLTLWPQGQPQPLASTLNALDGTVTSNMAIVPTSNGSINSFGSDPTHWILDITAYFAP